MDKEELLFRYLDGELEGEELEAAKSLLEGSPEVRELLERIRSEKMKVLERMHYMNPQQDIVTPKWPEPPESAGQRTSIIKRMMRWAAIIILPLAIFFVLREISDNDNGDLNDGNMLNDAEQEAVLPDQANIDYAISPNRCWTKKQLVGSEIISNSL
jgi:anti-sigma factor RsiW